ncbi:MAG: hypothetical protein H6642_06895 [Caldilineaceae bacterium]|nr:hypothetical protein [Caldilineaceae bacterium]
MRKLLVVCLALILTLLSASVVFAQDEGDTAASPFVACGVLEGDDCDLLLTAWKNMEQLTSGSSESNLALDVSNVPNLPMDRINLEVHRTAQFNADEALVQRLIDLQAMSSEEISALLADQDEYRALTAELIAGLDTAQTLNFTFSEELAATISEAAGMNIPTELKLDLVLKDGTVYIFLDDIIKFVPNIPPLLRGWVGIQIQPLIDQALADPDALGLPVGPEMLEFVAPGVGLAGVGLAMHAPLNRYADAYRQDDGSSDTATYEVDENFVGYFTSPEFRDLLMLVLEQADVAPEGELTADDVDQMASVLTMLAPVLFEDLSYTLMHDVDTASETVTSVAGVLDWDTTGLFETIATLQNSDEMMVESPPKIYMEGETVYSDSNSGAQVQAPGGAFVLPVQMIMGILGGM